MNPVEYEKHVAAILNSEGWQVELTPASGDYGVDIFARKPGSIVAVQVKMYGGTARRVNRAMMMQLYGAAAYFNCDRAMLVSDGDILPDAEEVARKLGIEIRNIAAIIETQVEPQMAPAASDFDAIWQKFIVPLAGQTLRRANDKSNEIMQVDWSGIRRRTSNGRVQFIEIEIFRDVIRRILRGETVTRAEINDEYPGRASSGIVLILGQVPLFEVVASPMALRLARRSP